MHKEISLYACASNFKIRKKTIMTQQQVQVQRKAVKRMSEAAVAFDAQQTEDVIRKARRATRRARNLTAKVEDFLVELEYSY